MKILNKIKTKSDSLGILDFDFKIQELGTIILKFSSEMKGRDQELCKYNLSVNLYTEDVEIAEREAAELAKESETKLFSALIEHTEYENLCHIDIKSKDKINKSAFQESLYEISDFDRDIDYKITRPSEKYTFYMLCCLTGEEFDNVIKIALKEIKSKMFMHELLAEDEVYDFSYISDCFWFGEFFTVKVDTEHDIYYDKLHSISESFLYEIAIKQGDVIFQDSNFGRYLNRVNKFFTHSEDGLSQEDYPEIKKAPYSVYNPELVRYYLDGLSSGSPSSQFLSYYHILEFFYSKISKLEIKEQLQEMLINPRFSPRNETSVEEIIRVVSKFYVSDSMTSKNEQTTLGLVLRRFIPERSLLESAIITQHGLRMISYYKKTKPCFTKEVGSLVNLESDDTGFHGSLQNRIYAIRNAIVHSKDAKHMSRYIPYDHDGILEYEIPLIKCVAELVIQRSAERL